jgi:hypothetical protein
MCRDDYEFQIIVFLLPVMKADWVHPQVNDDFPLSGSAALQYSDVDAPPNVPMPDKENDILDKLRTS